MGVVYLTQNNIKEYPTSHRNKMTWAKFSGWDLYRYILWAKLLIKNLLHPNCLARVCE